MLGTALMLAALAAWAAAEFPSLTGRVVDRAGLLSGAVRAELTQLLAAHERRTSNQVVVVTIDTLDDRDIADYGYRLGRFWGIGHTDRENGVLLIVAPNERRVRIEVGLGLKGTLTEAVGQQIIRTQLLPHFRRGAYEKGIQEGARAIVQTLEGTYQPVVAEENKAERIIPLLFIALLAFIVFSGFLGSFFGAAGHRGGRSQHGAAGRHPAGGGASGGW
jgi:uncharacterized protein